MIILFVAVLAGCGNNAKEIETKLNEVNIAVSDIAGQVESAKQMMHEKYKNDIALTFGNSEARDTIKEPDYNSPEILILERQLDSLIGLRTKYEGMLKDLKQ